MTDDRLKILIGYDGSRRITDVPQDLLYAGLPHEANTKIVSVVTTIIPAGMRELAFSPPIIEVNEREIEFARHAVKELCQRLRELYPNWVLESAVRWGRVALEIIHQTMEWRPDLVVVAPLSRGRFDRLVFGSLSRSIVENSQCSVRIPRRTELRGGMWLRLVIGFDGSKGATAAVREVASRPWPVDTEARLVVALKPSRGIRSNLGNVGEQRLRPALVAAEEILRGAGLEVTSEVRLGTPRQVLLDEAEDWGANCIFLGRNNRSSWSRLLLGSTSAAVASQAKCSVEVVREGKGMARPARQPVGPMQESREVCYATP
jgi:nucleotide-binding universal stress UspA family protein